MRHLIVLAAAQTLCAGDVLAQVVRGVVRNESTGAGLPGAIVLLVDTTGTRVTGLLTDDAGRYQLRAPAPGQFGLRVDVVGYHSVTTPMLAIAGSDTLTRDIVFRFQRSSLPAVAVTATTRCAQVSSDAGDAPLLWAEARKTLEAIRLAARDARFSVSLRRYDRVVGLPDSTIRSSRTWTQQGVTASPFESLAPDVVARDGFATGHDSARYYFAPDAAVLLSDAFVRGHCFGTRRGGPAGTVGLSFRPQQVTQRVDIEGVLWIDSATAELRSMEYRYVPAVGRPPVGGGYVAFGRYPSGLWGVQRWAIRLPMLRVMESRRRPDGALGRFVDTVVTAFREDGGELLAPATASAGARLAGEVFDSTSGRALAGATVVLEGLGHSVATDSAGRFAFDGLQEEGEVRLRARHPRLDSLGLAIPMQTARLRRSAEAVVRLAVPGVAAAARAHCPSAERGAARIVLGTVLGPGGRGLDADVALLERQALEGGGESLVRHVTATNDAGRFAFCGARAGSLSWVMARGPNGWEPPRPAGAGPVTIVPVEISPEGDTVPDGSVVLSRSAGVGTPVTLEGWIILPDEATGARVRVDDVARATVGRDGAFRVTGLAPGTRQVTFEAPGHLPARRAVEARSGESVLLLAALRPAPLVVVQRRPAVSLDRLGEFRQRRAAGNGYFLERPEIERLNPRTLTDLMRSVPGVRVISRGAGFAYTSTHFQRFPSRGGDAGNACDMMLYLDGQPFPMEGGDADVRIRVSELGAIEVYVSAGSVPRRYAGATAACGVILLWR